MSKGLLHQCLALLAVLLAGVATLCKAQNAANSMQGTDFWMMFLKQHESEVYDAPVCALLLAAEERSVVTIENPASGWDTTLTVPGEGVQRVSLPDNQAQTNLLGAVIENRAWHIQASKPVSVTAYNYREYTFDATAILPTPALRTEYMVQTYQSHAGGQEVGIVAPFGDTHIQLVFAKNVCCGTNSLDGIIYHAGDTLELTLMRGQTCLLSNIGVDPTDFDLYGGVVDLTGTRIHSNYPVAVFQGNYSGFVPYSYYAAEHLYDQCFPIEYWGTHFVFTPVIERESYVQYQTLYHSYGDIVRVLSLENGCGISLDGQAVAVLQSGEVFDFVISDHPDSVPLQSDMYFHHSPCVELTSTSPVMVCYYIASQNFAGHPSDPAVMTLPPIDDGVNSTIFHPYDTRVINQYWVNIVTATSNVSQMTLDRSGIANHFSDGGNGYSYARIQVSNATHRLSAGEGRFIAYHYGLGNTESYLHMAASTPENKPYRVWAESHSVCVGDSVEVGIDFIETGFIPSWYVDGQWIGDGMDRIRVSFSNAGTHKVMTVIAPTGDTAYTYITVNALLRVDINDTVCSGGSYLWHGHIYNTEGEYFDTLTVSVGCDTAYKLHLTVTPPNETSFVDSVCSGTVYDWHGVLLTGEGYYRDTISDVNGCDSIVSLSLTTLITPQISLVIEEDCNRKEYTILSLVEPGDSIMPFWSSLPTDSTLLGQQWDSIVVSPTEATRYTLAFDGRCPNDTSIVLLASEWPVAAMEVNPQMLDFDNLQFVAQDVSLNATGRMWYVDDDYAGNAPTLFYSASATADSVWLMLVSNRGECADTAYFTIPVNRSVIWAPNAFTPAGDNNERFIVKGNDVTMKDIYIYARNGVLVWHSDNPSEGWDGTSKRGSLCPQATYTWILRYVLNSQPKLTKKAIGTVILLR